MEPLPRGTLPIYNILGPGISEERKIVAKLDGTAHSILTSLPAELLHNILSSLDTASLSNVRLTCRLLSVLGLDHFGDEIPLVLHRDKFRNLTRIATHPVLSKRMRSLYYAGDLLKFQEWHEWYIRRSPTAHYRNAVMEFATEIELRARVDRLRPQRALGIMDLPETRSIADVAAFGRFNELYADQAMILQERLDDNCFRAMFEGCPNLREATVAFRSDDGAPQRRLKAARTAFAEAMTVAHLRVGGHEPGRHHLVALAQALKDSGRSLDSLTVVNVYYGALYGEAALKDSVSDLHVGRDENPFQLRVLVRSLKRLRVFMHMADKRHERQFHPAEPAASVFTEAPELRALRIRLPDRIYYHRREPLRQRKFRDRVLETVFGGLDLNYVFRRMTYPHLYELSLANCSLCGDTFANFILRHKETLRRLSLQNMLLGAYCHDSDMQSWPGFFTRIAGRFANIHQVKIRGFLFERKELVMNWCAPQASGSSETELFCPARDAIENFILTGGALPWDQIVLGEPDLLTPRWEPKGEDYVAPGIPDRDRPVDDPAREYEEDEFDDDRTADDLARDYEEDEFEE